MLSAFSRHRAERIGTPAPNWRPGHGWQIGVIMTTAVFHVGSHRINLSR